MANRRLFAVSEGELRGVELALGLDRDETAMAALAAVGEQAYVSLEASLAGKRLATPGELRAYSLEDDKPYIEVEGRLFRLLREDEDDHLSPAEIEMAVEDRLLWDESGLRPACTSTPDSVDHRPDQTPIRDQELRGTCVCFASLACLEALELRQGTTVDLSEQYANWLFMGFEGRDQCDDGMKTTDAASYLSRRGVPEEALWLYEDEATVRQHCSDQPSPTARQQARFGIGRYVIIDRLGLNGPSIANTAYLECLLSEGYDIVFGLHVAWGQPTTDGIFDLIRDPYGNPLPSRGGHAMLLVGYDRRGSLPYLVFKNSWGTTGVNGYYYLSYDYVRYYSKYGYVVMAARDDMPTA